MPRAVFLDRDGVLNRCFVRSGVPHPPQTLAEIGIEAGVPEALAKLKGAGYLLLVVTNQPDVARGNQTREVVESINQQLRDQFPIDDVAVCYHDNADNCACRKPKPGMLTTLAKKWHVDLHHSFMVGDRSGDIHAGESAGVRTFLVDRPYSKGDTCRPDFRVRDLAHAAEIILQMQRVEPPGVP
jgi:D-glycero-D-manno-heptose 1,7-bisphosphate phosphatase